MIRPATPSDIPMLLDMGERFHAESNFGAHAPYNAASWESTLNNFLSSEIWRVLVWDDGGVRGFIAGSIMPLYFNHSVTVSHELLWWVMPDHRRGAGQRLLDAFHADADLGFQTVSETTPRCEAVKRKLRMDGWQHIESGFMKELG